MEDLPFEAARGDGVWSNTVRPCCDICCNVVYERYYDKFSDLEKADVRAAFYGTTEPYLQSLKDGAEYAARFKSGAVVARTEGDLFFYALGSGEYDELSLSEVIDVIVLNLRDVLKKQPSEALLWDNYGRLCLLIDEIVNEGIVDATDRDAIQRGIRLKCAALPNGLPTFDGHNF